MIKFFNFSLLLLTLIPFHLTAQNISGKVIDSENTIELSEVEIMDSKNNLITSTNSKGLFQLNNFDTYTFIRKGYITKAIVINDSEFQIIGLEPEPEYLNEIQITSTNFHNKLKTSPSAISIISGKEILSNNTLNIAPIINSVPGVFMHNGTLNTNRITIRGIGSRNLFGTSKIRAYYEDIPLTNGSGESSIEDIELSTLGRIEILKGPSSSKFGAGLGGTIQLIPDKGQFNEKSFEGNYTFGSFGLQKYLFKVNLGNLTNSAKITYSNTHSDGYRDNNELDRQVISVATNHFLGDKDKLTFIGNYIKLKAFIPSSLNEDDYLNNPESAAFTWGRAKGYEDYKKGLFGISWQHDFNKKTKLITSIFTSFLDSYEPRPFNILKEKTNAIGLRTRIISESELFSKSLNWTVGGEIFNDKNLYQTYENLYRDFPPEIGSVQGDQLSDLKENRTYLNLFLDSKYKISSKTNFSFGLNLNNTSYKLDDYFNNDSSNLSGEYNFDIILSPKFGLTHQIHKAAMIYGTISHGFSPPTLEETLLPDGMINNAIKPESGWNYEIGSRGNIFQDKLFFDLAIYRMNVENLLVARRTAGDEYIGINAGKTQYNGIELALNYHIINSEKFKIYHRNSIAYNDFKFKEFIDDENDYSGNQLTGIPKFTFFSQLYVDSEIGIYGFLSFNYVDEIPMRDDNSVYSDAYNLVNAKIGYKKGINKKLFFDIYVGINNLFDEKYASMILINAGSFGNNAPRYYYPGEPMNYYSGASLKYIF